MRFALSFLVLFLLAQQSYAHRLIVEAKPSFGSVKIEAYYFEDDTPAQNARVVLLKNDVVIQKGLTNDKGVCVLELNETGEISVRVESVGHAASTKFNALAIVKSETPPEPVETHETEKTSFGFLDLQKKVLELPTGLRVCLGFLVIAVIGGVGYTVLKRKR